VSSKKLRVFREPKREWAQERGTGGTLANLKDAVDVVDGFKLVLCELFQSQAPHLLVFSSNSLFGLRKVFLVAEIILICADLSSRENKPPANTNANTTPTRLSRTSSPRATHTKRNKEAYSRGYGDLAQCKILLGHFLQAKTARSAATASSLR
jgi:hypothetical protein